MHTFWLLFISQPGVRDLRGELVTQSKTQQGFTLIELMIVVAIIGILAAVAIPSYQDYTARAQVTEAVSMATAFKTTMAEFYSDNGGWPLTLTAVGTTTAGKYVGSMTIAAGAGSPNGTLVISATMKSKGVNSQVQNSVYALETVDGGKQWNCGNNVVNSGGLGATIDSKFLPGACK